MRHQQNRLMICFLHMSIPTTLSPFCLKRETLALAFSVEVPTFSFNLWSIARWQFRNFRHSLKFLLDYFEERLAFVVRSTFAERPYVNRLCQTDHHTAHTHPLQHKNSPNEKIRPIPLSNKTCYTCSHDVVCEKFIVLRSSGEECCETTPSVAAIFGDQLGVQRAAFFIGRRLSDRKSQVLYGW